MNVAELFEQMCKYTVPHGYEPMLYPLVLGFVPERGVWEVDDDMNLHVFIPVDNDMDSVGRVMWACHLDTASYGTPEPIHIHERIQNHARVYGCRADDDLLGADCHTGAAIMCKMMEVGIPGWYVFHAGEEQGMIGSEALAKEFYKWPFPIDKVVSFDRMYQYELITHQCGERTCSDEFAEYVCSKSPFRWIPSSRGIFTDSYAYRDIVPECTNVAVGYENQHGSREIQDIKYMEKLCKWMLNGGANIFIKAPVARNLNDDDGGYGSYHPDDYGCPGFRESSDPYNDLGYASPKDFEGNPADWGNDPTLLQEWEAEMDEDEDLSDLFEDYDKIRLYNPDHVDRILIESMIDDEEEAAHA